ncbi:hypothetical protein C5167_037812 [Papaver somniferum]|uniref:Transposase MuDR plant domain-containing protein n=1 Tax=Papaver somniferum TaxID=3469 RepID=A0A4Y7I7F9_PAPSO|nr:hypothetical protein C5167_037812 [Papaver somniferum]
MYANIMRKYVKNPVRRFRVEESETNKVRFFDNVSVNCGGLNGFCDVVHAAYQLPPIKKVNLTWFSDTDPFYIGSNDEFYEMWDKGVVEDDGYIYLYMNVTHMKVPLTDEFHESSGVSVAQSCYSTPHKAKTTSFLHIDRDAPPVNLDTSSFLTPRKRLLYSKSPELLRRSPRLVSKSIAAVIGSAKKSLFVNMDDDEVVDAEISVELRLSQLEYENNIQLTNNDIDVCHPIDDCRSHIVMMQKWVLKYETSNEKNCDGIENDDPKGKTTVVDEPSDADSGDSSSSSDSEVEEGALSVQNVAEDDEARTVWIHQYEQVWEPHVEDVERTCDFDDDTGNGEQFIDVDIIFVGMEFMDRKDFKNHLRGYAVNKKFQYKLRPNDAERIKVNCKYNKS